MPQWAFHESSRSVQPIAVLTRGTGSSPVCAVTIAEELRHLLVPTWMRRPANPTRRRLALAPLIRFLEEHRVGVTEARVIRPSLEDVFVEITGIELERMKKEEEKGGRRS